jgi:hypothetical protein
VVYLRLDRLSDPRKATYHIRYANSWVTEGSVQIRAFSDSLNVTALSWFRGTLLFSLVSTTLNCFLIIILHFLNKAELLFHTYSWTTHIYNTFNNVKCKACKLAMKHLADGRRWRDNGTLEKSTLELSDMRLRRRALASIEHMVEPSTDIGHNSKIYKRYREIHQNRTQMNYNYKRGFAHLALKDEWW